jgi:hypothetical protein
MGLHTQTLRDNPLPVKIHAHFCRPGETRQVPQFATAERWHDLG